MGTHLRVLGESYPMNTNMIGLRSFLKIFESLRFWAKVALALKGYEFLEKYLSEFIILLTITLGLRMIQQFF